MSDSTESSPNNSIVYSLVNGVFYVQYVGTNFIAAVLLGQIRFLPNADQNAWRDDIFGSFIITLGAASAIMLVPAVIFGFANIISKKWKNRPANGWFWLEVPTFLIYLVIIFGYMQGWALKF
jgi:hypothetical protein